MGERLLHASRLGRAARTAARRRLMQELGIGGLRLLHRDRVEYRADVGGGLTEHEVVDIFAATAPAGLRLQPDPAEVMETRWVALAQLTREIAATPERFTPWLRIYMDSHAAAIFGDAEWA